MALKTFESASPLRSFIHSIRPTTITLLLRPFFEITSGDKKQKKSISITSRDRKQKISRRVIGNKKFHVV